MGNYFQKEIECASADQIRAWQSERLVKQVKNIYDNVPYYRTRMQNKGLEPSDIKSIDDLHKLPFITKDDLRDAYPYGLLARPLKDCVRMQSTSGTTGRRVVAFYTQHDLDLWEDCCARAIVAAGGTKEDVVHVSYGYGLFTGGFGLNGGLRDVDLTINKGECVLLCGRSGCGKTTLTRLVNGLIPYFYPGEVTGTTYVDGKNIQDYPIYEVSEYVGSVFQNPRSQFFNVDTDSEISFGMENLTYPREKMKERISKTVADLDIAHLTGRSIFELSGGEKQKVAFASIYAMSPSIYLLDEPSSNLDMDAIEDLRRTLELLKKQGKTILIAEHRIYYLRELVDRIAYMENGAISAVFSPSQFLSIPEEQRHSMGLRALDLSKVQPRAFAENSQKPILEVRNLSLFYKKKLVLDDLNLSAAPGEIIGIIGHNGAGKSTFSRTLCGLHTNCTGQILWDGKELNAKSRLKRSYMVMQDVSYQLFADTLEKECVFGIKHPDLDAAKQAMERLGIYEYRTHHPNTLSGGQKQRAAVAVSMVCRKDVLIFDEPTSGLDYDSMIQVAGLFQTLSKMGKVIFVVTHDYEFLAAACTRVIHLDNGKQQEDYPLSPDNLHRLHDFFLRSERRQNLEENGK